LPAEILKPVACRTETDRGPAGPAGRVGLPQQPSLNLHRFRPPATLRCSDRADSKFQDFIST